MAFGGPIAKTIQEESCSIYDSLADLNEAATWHVLQRKTFDLNSTGVRFSGGPTTRLSDLRLRSRPKRESHDLIAVDLVYFWESVALIKIASEG